METFIGTKIIKAQPGKEPEPLQPTSADPLVQREPRDGYEVHYPDGYVSWSPKDVFEEAYRKDGQMNFGHALEILKQGQAVSRRGWNGKGMFLYLVPANSYPVQTQAAARYFGVGSMVPYGAYIAMKTADGNVVPWLCSQTDALADDWGIVRPEEHIDAPTKKFK